MVHSNRCQPLVFDYIELRLRMPVKRPGDTLIRDAGIALPICRLL